MSEEFREKVQSLSFTRRAGSSRTIVEKGEGGRTIAETTEHWDGRVDAVVHPDVLRYGARVHKTGAKAGEVAEVRTMNRKERGERYGD